MRYMDKKIKPSSAVALTKHILRCADCRDEFLLFDAAMDKTREAEAGMYALEETPAAFTGAAMEKIKQAPLYQPILKLTRADIVIRALWCLCALGLALGLAVMYNQETFAAWLAAYPQLSAAINSFNALTSSWYAAFESFLSISGLMGQQATALFAGVSNMSLILVFIAVATLAVVLRGEKANQ